MSTYDPVSLGIIWDRLIAITDETLSSLVRTSFSTNVRESYDLSCMLFDSKMRSIAQGTYSVPSFTGTAPNTVRMMLEKHPPHTLRDGDVLATNDPWIGTGHLYDINVLRPIFYRASARHRRAGLFGDGATDLRGGAAAAGGEAGGTGQAQSAAVRDHRHQCARARADAGRLPRQHRVQ